MKFEFTVDRFEDNKAVLRSEYNETVIWPKEKLPTNIKEGSIVAFMISDGSEIKDEKTNLAKDILNEILNVEE